MIRSLRAVEKFRAALFSSQAVRLGAALAALGLALSWLPPVGYLEENVGLDWLFTDRGSRLPPPEVAIVAIDKPSADKLELSQEPRLWPRALHAELIEKLYAAGASAIVFDIYFDKPRDAREDQQLGQAVSNAGNVVLFEYIDKDFVGEGKNNRESVFTEKLIRPIPVIGDGALITAPFALPVVPVKVSRFWAFKDSVGNLATLPVAAYQAHTREAIPQFNRLLQQLRPDLLEPIYEAGVAEDGGFETRDVMSFLRTTFVQDVSLAAQMHALLEQEPDMPFVAELNSLIDVYKGPGSYYLNFYGPPRTVPTYSYADVLRIAPDSSVSASLDMDLFRDRVVFVGYSAETQPEQKDSFYSVYSQQSGLNIAGVEIAATAFANIVDRSSVQPLGNGMRALLLLVWGVLAGMLAYALTPVVASVICWLLALAYLQFAAWHFSRYDLWLPVLVPLFQLLLAWVLVLGWKLVVTRDKFGQFVPRQEVDRLTSGHHDDSQGEWIYRVLLSADIAQYTTSTERYTTATGDTADEVRSEALWLLMNQYFNVLNKTVAAHGGQICDQEGDSSIAIWGRDENDRLAPGQALEAALALQVEIDRFHNEEVAEFNRDMRSRFGVLEELSLPTRIGLHAGWVRIGKIGGGHHFEFHVFGDPVNTVSRVQQFNKQLGTTLLVTGDVLSAVSGVCARELGDFLLKGKSRPVSLYEPLNMASAVRKRGIRALLPGGTSQARKPQVSEGVSEAEKRLEKLSGDALAALRSRDWKLAEQFFTEVLEIRPGDRPVRNYLQLIRQIQSANYSVPADWQSVILVSQTGGFQLH